MQTRDWADRRRDIEKGRHWMDRGGSRARWRNVPFRLAVAVLGRLMQATPLYRRGLRNSLEIECIAFEMALPSLAPA